MSTHEVRYHGRLIGHFTQTEASDYALRRAAEPGIEKDKLTIEPRRPVKLRLRGSLIDTFHDDGAAEARIRELVDESTAMGMQPPTTSEDFTIEDSRRGVTPAAGPATEPAPPEPKAEG